LKDPNNCGGCAIPCGGGMTCANGICCPSGQTNCSGVCRDTTSDPKNCGTCGNICQMGSCSASMCGSCNKKALLVADMTMSTPTLVTALQNGGLTVTTADVTTYNGSPDAATFGAVLVTNGTKWSVDMPDPGQKSIVAAQASNAQIGVVLTEWVAYEVQISHYQTLKALLLSPRQAGNQSKMTFTLQSAHPIWTGLPSSFVSVNSMGYNQSMNLGAGAKTIATCTECNNIGVAVKDPMGAGRIVQIAHAGDYNSPQAWSDANIAKMIQNAVLWAARCL